MNAERDTEYRAYWEAASDWQRYLREEVREHRELWEGLWKKHRTPPWAAARAREAGDWKLLVLSEDWCGDASNTVPVLARLAEAVPNVEMRILRRDENPELMDRWLTNGSRSIPKVIVLDPAFDPVASWGPRPGELQALVVGEKRKGEMPASEIYKEARRWYARDGGETTLGELLEVLEAAAEKAGVFAAR